MIRNYLFIFIVFFNFAFAESFPIVTDNKDLLKSIKEQFANQSISNSSLQKFLLKNSYYSAELRQEKGKTVIKNPSKIIFIFKGNKVFTEQKLRKLVKIDENKIGSFFYNFVEKAIKQAYQEKGFLNVKIEKIEEQKNWKKWIFLNISEGPKTRIGSLKVKGLLSQPSSYYEKFIRDNSAELIKSGVYNKKELEKGYKNLINHLKSEGYLQSKIYSDRVFFKDSKAFITINLEEGPLTLIRDIQIKNAKSVPVWEILSHIKSRIQSTLKVDVVQKDLKRIEDLYKSKGYMQVKITNKDNIIKYTPASRYVDIVIEINEGSKAFISKISFTGLKEVKPDLISSLLKFEAGDVLTPLKKEKSLQALSATGLFSNINLNEHIKDNKFEVIAVFKERKARTLRGGLGFNSQRGITTQAWTELTHRNLFGWGRALVARASSQINLTQGRPFFEYEFSSRYKEVFIPKYGYQGDVSLSHSKNLFKYSEENINFVKRTQLSFFIDKNISESLKLKWNAFSFESRKEFCSNQNCPENPQQIASTNIKFSWDKRNNIFAPSEGYLLSWTTEWADPLLGSNKNIAFIKTDINSYFYWSFLENYIFGFVLKGGVISTVQNSRYIPVSRAFILGGYTSLRGYDGHIEGERIP
ncbi:MAG: BamA/TamA family outer membrane protein, partial [Oligoflexia bacterium]|nr:BamA/TamA family outer membrane protein [Oligoflexia bacterium]